MWQSENCMNSPQQSSIIYHSIDGHIVLTFLSLAFNVAIHSLNYYELKILSGSKNI